MLKLAAILLLSVSTPVLAASGTSPTSAPPRSGTLPINGVNYYYELRGQGEPLLLLHGGLGTFEMFGPVLDTLAQTRTVIGVDLQGHGRTRLGTRPFKLESMGDDMAALVKQLGYEKVDVMGYSFGGGVAFRMAVQHPQRVRRLVLVSAGYSDDGFHADLRQQQVQVSGKMAPMMKDTPMYKSYAAVAPDVNEFPKLLDAIGGFMKQHYDYAEDVKKLQMPVMLVWGDSDMFRPEHMVKFYQLLGGGLRDAGWQREHMSRNRLAILPDLTHYDIAVSPRLAATVLPFLDGKSENPSWAEQVNRAAK